MPRFLDREPSAVIHLFLGGDAGRSDGWAERSDRCPYGTGAAALPPLRFRLGSIPIASRRIDGAEAPLRKSLNPITKKSVNLTESIDECQFPSPVATDVRLSRSSISRKASIRVSVLASSGSGRSPSRVKTGFDRWWRRILSSIWRKQKVCA